AAGDLAGRVRGDPVRVGEKGDLLESRLRLLALARDIAERREGRAERLRRFLAGDALRPGGPSARVGPPAVTLVARRVGDAVVVRVLWALDAVVGPPESGKDVLQVTHHR